MAQIDGVSEALVDTTARAVIRMEDPKAKITQKKLDAALKPLRLRARKIARQKLPTERSEFVLKMEGFG